MLTRDMFAVANLIVTSAPLQECECMAHLSGTYASTTIGRHIVYVSDKLTQQNGLNGVVRDLQ